MHFLHNPAVALGIFVLGVVVMALVFFRQASRRRAAGNSYYKYIEKVKFRPLDESNEFGQNPRWIIEPDEQTGKGTDRDTEPPAGAGG